MIMKQKIFLVSGLLIFSLFACKQQAKNKDQGFIINDFIGIYVTDGYSQRSEGYDWMAISIEALNDSTALVAVRSRADLKRPSCTFYSKGFLSGDSILVIPYEDKKFKVGLQGEQLAISGMDEKSTNTLYYFCSGGATLEGTYIKLEEIFDNSQLQYTDFQDTLSLQGITFFIRADNTGFTTTLRVEPSGLEIDNRPVEHQIHGWVSGAEIEDLNSDGFPEVVIYIRSTDGGNIGSVIAYSVNNGKSMSQVYMPDLKDDPEASQGYMGHDEFTLVETSLVRRFPVFELTDSGIIPVDRIRQIQYKMVDGEASRKFQIVSVNEYDMN